MNPIIFYPKELWILIKMIFKLGFKGGNYGRKQRRRISLL